MTAPVAASTVVRRIIPRPSALILIGVFGFLAACSSTLVDYSTPVHVVQPGETLHAIAWRHGLDYKDLARWNRLSNPDLLLVGQRLSLRPPSVQPAAGASSSSPAPRSSPATPEPRAQPLPAPPRVPPPRWSWPTRGPLLHAFGSREGLSNGIAIGGQLGQDVRAAAAGRVVYAGSGLQAYGQLVIINHNDSFLSAYGFNERLVVAQGEDVESGQVIARMGLGPERRPQLHFEIRQNGTPVDPLRHLPR
ncbi:MAG TPA: peptidoglycan DD-metalloendopeptidase family protein [Gammaproteobacteria bacterium]|nr:peptidoglycan DD-metalloendopeptidase family protein [Gammaproteobacteria bacterium]